MSTPPYTNPLPYRPESNWLGRFFATIGTLPSVQFKVLWLCVMDIITASMAWYLAVKDRSHDSPIFDAWLILLAGLHGINLTAFGVKRFTDSDFAAAKVSGTNPSADRDAAADVRATARLSGEMRAIDPQAVP